MLKIDIHATSHVATLRCSGRIVLGLEAETLRCMALSRSEACLILDLGDIHSIDANGLGLLVELHCAGQYRGRTLKIVNAPHCVRALVELTSLQSVLDIAGDEEAYRSDAGASPWADRRMTA